MDSNASNAVRAVNAEGGIEVLGIASVDTHGVRNTGEDMGGITTAGISED